jgi:hypothetical protein
LSKEPKMNSITVFLAIACVAIGAVFGVMGYVVLGAASLVCQSACKFDPSSASNFGSDAYSMIVFVFMARQSA